MAETGDAARTSLEAGNSPKMIFRHYREIVDGEAAIVMPAAQFVNRASRWAAEIRERSQVFLPAGNVVPKPQPAPFQQFSLRKDILLLSGILVAQRELSLREDNGGSGTLELLARTNNFPRWQVV